MVSSLNNLRVLIESNKPFITRVDEFLKDESGSINDGNSSFVFDKFIKFKNVSLVLMIKKY